MMKNSTSINEVSSFPHDSVEDFACKPSIVSESEVIMSAGGPVPLPLCAKPSLRPQVRISQFSQLFIIPYDDAKSKWYTQEEYNLFNRTRISDALRLRNLLQGETCEINEDVLCELVGLETYIFPHSARHGNQKKRAHRDAVLVLAQKMHQSDDDNMIEKLSESSKKSSRWARERAAKIAACYATY
jgi:hypothetical protein